MLRFIGWRWKHIVIFPLHCRDKKNESLINLSPSETCSSIYDPKTFHHQVVSFLEKSATDNSVVSILWCMLTILPHLDVTTIIYLFGENFVRVRWRNFGLEREVFPDKNFFQKINFTAVHASICTFLSGISWLKIAHNLHYKSLKVCKTVAKKRK